VAPGSHRIVRQMDRGRVPTVGVGAATNILRQGAAITKLACCGYSWTWRRQLDNAAVHQLGFRQLKPDAATSGVIRREKKG